MKEKHIVDLLKILINNWYEDLQDALEDEKIKNKINYYLKENNIKLEDFWYSFYIP